MFGDDYSTGAVAVYNDGTSGDLRPKRRRGKRSGQLIQLQDEPIAIASTEQAPVATQGENGANIRKGGKFPKGAFKGKWQGRKCHGKGCKHGKCQGKGCRNGQCHGRKQGVNTSPAPVVANASA